MRSIRVPTLLVLASTYPRWSGDPEPGFVHELCKRLTAHFSVYVITSHAAGARRTEVMDGVRIERYRYAPERLETLVYGGGIAAHLRTSPWKWLLVPGFILGQWWAARRLAQQVRFDVIHAHWLIPQGLLARHLWRRGRVGAYVVTSHGGDLYGFRGLIAGWLKRQVAADAAVMTVVSSGMLDEAKAQRIAARDMRVIPMGADLGDRFTPDPDTPRKPDNVLFAGRLVEKKGLTHLLAAMPAVLQEHPDATLTVAGFGPLREPLEAQAKHLGIEHAVRFMGAVGQDRLPALYRSAALLVAPFVRAASGDLEGLPVVLMEAIGCGCPVLASDIPGVRDLLGGDCEDCLVPPGDPKMLADRICHLLSDPAESIKRTMPLREAALERVDWSVVARRYADVLAIEA